MNILTLDCEFNQPSRRTIQIGAAVFKAKSGELIETFNTYVDPLEPISPEITRLTGIIDSDVRGAPLIKEAFLALKAFHKKHKCTKNPLVWGSGTRNDSSHLHEESGLNEQNFMGFRVTDAKTLYQSLQIFRNGTIKGGLEKACDTLGIKFDEQYGPPHRALADAYNTFRIWHFMMEKFYKGMATDKPKCARIDEKVNSDS